MNKLWFTRKTYGYGWTPSAWEGWLVVAIFTAGNVLNFYRIMGITENPNDTLLPYIIELGISTLFLLCITLYKGEKPKWQWGKKTSASK